MACKISQREAMNYKLISTRISRSKHEPASKRFPKRTASETVTNLTVIVIKFKIIPFFMCFFPHKNRVNKCEMKKKTIPN